MASDRPETNGFPAWWAAFNAALTARGMSEATLDVASLHVWWGRSPEQAAEWEVSAHG